MKRERQRERIGLNNWRENPADGRRISFQSRGVQGRRESPFPTPHIQRKRALSGETKIIIIIIIIVSRKHHVSSVSSVVAVVVVVVGVFVVGGFDGAEVQAIHKRRLQVQQGRTFCQQEVLQFVLDLLLSLLGSAMWDSYIGTVPFRQMVDCARIMRS